MCYIIYKKQMCLFCVSYNVSNRISESEKKIYQHHLANHVSPYSVTHPSRKLRQYANQSFFYNAFSKCLSVAQRENTKNQKMEKNWVLIYYYFTFVLCVCYQKELLYDTNCYLINKSIHSIL